MRDEFKRECQAICPNECELCDIILDMCYKSSHSKQFAWEICVDTIIHNLLAKITMKFHMYIKIKTARLFIVEKVLASGRQRWRQRMIILNERTEAERIIETGNVGEKPSETLSLLARYYYNVEKLTGKNYTIS